MKLNYFSDKEQKAQQKFKKLRDNLLGWVARCLKFLHITPNVISVTGLFVLVAFFYFAYTEPIIAFFILVLHVVLDGLDGVLARLTNTQSQGGAFLDMVCDHTGMVIVTVTLIFHTLLNPTIGVIYVYLYSLLVILITVRNLLNKPIGLVFRSKYILYILFGVYAFTGINIFDIAVFVFSLFMIAPIIISMSVIISELNNKE